MSCDHSNPIGSADIPAGDTAERPEFPDPLSMCWWCNTSIAVEVGGCDTQD